MNYTTVLSCTPYTNGTQHNKVAYQHYEQLTTSTSSEKFTIKLQELLIVMSAAHTEKIILIFCECKNHSKVNTTTIICDILNHSQGNFVTEIKQIS